jgi:hypothetical protein
MSAKPQHPTGGPGTAQVNAVAAVRAVLQTFQDGYTHLHQMQFSCPTTRYPDVRRAAAP